MKRVLLVLASVALAVPAFASSITFYGPRAEGPYVGGRAAVWKWEHSTGIPAWRKVDGGGVLARKGAFALNTEWTDASTHIVNAGAGPSSRNGNALNGVHSQRFNLTSGGSGRPFTNGHGRPNGNVRTTVPEPGTLGLLGTGLFFIGGLVRRKMKMR